MIEFVIFYSLKNFILLINLYFVKKNFKDKIG